MTLHFSSLMLTCCPMMLVICVTMMLVINLLALLFQCIPSLFLLCSNNMLLLDYWVQCLPGHLGLHVVEEVHHLIPRS